MRKRRRITVASAKRTNYRTTVTAMSPVVVKICELFTFPYTTTDTPGAAFTLVAGGDEVRVFSTFVSAVFGVSAVEANEGVLFPRVVLPKSLDPHSRLVRLVRSIPFVPVCELFAVLCLFELTTVELVTDDFGSRGSLLATLIPLFRSHRTLLTYL